MNNTEMLGGTNEVVTSKTNLFKGEEKLDSDENGNKKELKADSQEDLEAIVQDANLGSSNNSSTHNLNKSKINGYIKESAHKNNGGNGEIEQLSRQSSTPRIQRDRLITEEEKEYDERGGSGNLNEAGNIESPKSQINNSVPLYQNEMKSVSKDHHNDSTLKENLKVTNIGWNEENKNKIQVEEDKNDEEKSLLDPINDDNYSKDELSKNDDRDIRRSSTKPEKILSESKNKSRDSSNLIDESIDEK